MSSKRSNPDKDLHSRSCKQFKIEHADKFSFAVKERLASSTRTGQACNRCKVRKIRCDGHPGRCSPCLQSNTECFTTDRITGRATCRGYIENLEQQIRDLHAYNRKLEQRLREVDSLKCLEEYNDGSNSSQSVHTIQNLNSFPHSMPQQQLEMGVNQFSEQMPASKLTLLADDPQNISEGIKGSSPISGAVLSILGMEIDIAGPISEDFDKATGLDI